MGVSVGVGVAVGVDVGVGVEVGVTPGSAGAPAVVLGQDRPHDEQAATARALDRLGLAATGVGWPAAHQWPGLLGTERRIGGSGWERWLGPGARGIAEVLREV